MKRNVLTPVRLIAPVTENVWGGAWIKDAKGLVSPAGPVGESWEFSALPARPSQVMMPNGATLPLPEVIRRNPEGLLGQRVAHRFGPTAPFLTKIIDAQDNLSLQVHPPHDAACLKAGEAGKSESWVVLDAGEGPDEGWLYIGFNPAHPAAADPATLRRAFQGAIEASSASPATAAPGDAEPRTSPVLALLNRIRVRPGEVVDLRAGTIHAIGRGVRLFEIQQTSDTTYRVWDWNRARPGPNAGPATPERPLHVTNAMAVLDFAAKAPDAFRLHPASLQAPVPTEPLRTRLVNDADGHYALDRIVLPPNTSLTVETKGSFSVLTVISGAARLTPPSGPAITIPTWETVLVPGATASFVLHGQETPADIFIGYVP